MTDKECLALRAKNNIQNAGLIPFINHAFRYLKASILAKSDLGWVYTKRQYRKQTASDTDADPLKLIWIKPCRVQYVAGEIEEKYDPESIHLQHFTRQFQGIENFGAVKGGKWDVHQDKFTQLLEYRGIKQRYSDNLPWEKTDFFKIHLNIIKNEGHSYGSESREELLKKCQQYERLLYDIKENGYKTQRELGRANPTNEITVNIGRNGQFLFNGGGRHRLSIAKLLNIEEIPIVVKIRHKQWQIIREKAAKNPSKVESNSNINRFKNHPDLRDLK